MYQAVIDVKPVVFRPLAAGAPFEG